MQSAKRLEPKKSMQLLQLRELVKKGEGQLLEFKRKAAFPEKIVREIVAFANSQGGFLIVGVDDDGSIPGLKYVDEEKFILNKAIADFCSPAIRYHHIAVRLSDNRSVLVYEIFESRRKPHYLLPTPNARYGKAYIRVKDQSLQASQEVVQILKRKNRNKGFALQFGEVEHALMKYIDHHEYITLNKLSEIAAIPRYVASRKLTAMVLSNVLSIEAGEKEDRFFLKPDKKLKHF